MEGLHPDGFSTRHSHQALHARAEVKGRSEVRKRSVDGFQQVLIAKHVVPAMGYTAEQEEVVWRDLAKDGQLKFEGEVSNVSTVNTTRGLLVIVVG